MELGDLFDVKRVLVDRFQVSYSEIPCITKYINKSTYQEIVFTVKRACDLINMVDFAIPNPENLSQQDNQENQCRNLWTTHGYNID